MSLRTVNRMLSMLSRTYDPKKSTVPLVFNAPQKPPCHRITVARPFVRVAPEEQGVSSDTVAEFLRALRDDRTLNMHSVLVLRGGQMIAQATFGEQDAGLWKMTFSACKSIISLAVGMLVDEGKLALSDHVVEFFPDKTTPVSRLKYKELTVEHLLTMTSGAAFNEAGAVTETDWVRAFFAAAPTTKPGQTFNYNSLNSYLLAALIQRVSGQTVCEFLTSRLFAPLGITEYFWETCPEGIEKGGWGLYMGAEDLAKIGQLVLQQGVWNGQRLISAEWLIAATVCHAVAPHSYGNFNYGYQIWCGREQPCFLFNGMMGQNVLGFPHNGVLLVTHAGNDELFQQSRYFELAERYFGGKFPAVLPRNPAAEQHLAQTVAALCSGTSAAPNEPWWRRLFAPKREPLPPLCRQLNGVTLAADETDAASVGLLPMMMQTTQNNYASGLSRIAFAVEKDTLVMTYTEREDTHRVDIGFGTACDGEVYFRGEPYRIRTLGRVATNEDGVDVLVVTIDFVETPSTRQLRFYFEEDGVRLRQTEHPGEPLLALFRSELRRSLEKQPLVGAAVEKLDEDYLIYRTRRIWAPEVQLQPEK